MHENLDLLRAVEVFLRGVPAASLYAMREGQRSVGILRSNQIGVVDRMTSATLYLTANTDTAYGSAFLDLTDGPIVVEVLGRLGGVLSALVGLANGVDREGKGVIARRVLEHIHQGLPVRVDTPSWQPLAIEASQEALDLGRRDLSDLTLSEGTHDPREAGSSSPRPRACADSNAS